MPHAVANRYARALADLLVAPGAGLEPRGALEQLSAFEAVLKETPAVRQVLLSPAVTGARKHALLARFERMLGLSRLIRNFLCVLVDHRRTALLGEIREALESVLDERLGQVKAEVASASEVTAAQRLALETQLSRLSGKRVRAHYTIDESLIGGAIARVGSTVYDGSVRGQLAAIRRRLAAGA